MPQQRITIDNNRQQWITIDNNGQQWTTMDNNPWCYMIFLVVIIKLLTIPQRERRAGGSSPEAVEPRSPLADGGACSRNISQTSKMSFRIDTIALYQCNWRQLN